MSDWHTLNPSEAADRLETSPERGLAPEEAARRLARDGANVLVDRGSKSPGEILVEQFRSLLVILLLVAAVVSGAILGEWVDGSVILGIVILNAILGFRQEYRAERAMAALRRLASAGVRVRRGGEDLEVPSEELVVGDVITLEAGSVVPADGRLLQSADVRIQEASLTGESLPVEKSAAATAEADTALGDRTGMVYRGTAVQSGRATALVVATGMATELGKIADSLQTVEDEDTPLQEQLDRLGRLLVVGAVGLIVLIATIGLARAEELRTVFLTAVSMAVAAVPEGLPAVVTIALALGAQRMLARRALIRKLPAVETLGSVTTICSDKTGTLTQNRMTVTLAVLPDSRVDLLGGGGGNDGEDDAGSGALSPEVILRLQAGCLASDARVASDPDADGKPVILGDPTEGALVLAARDAGLEQSALSDLFPRIGEAPFDSERKRMTTLHTLPTPESLPPGALSELWSDAGVHENGRLVAFTKGAVDSLLEISTRIRMGGETRPLDPDTARAISEESAELAGQGIRVLGVGYRLLTAAPDPVGAETLEREIVYLGMLGMLDPVRPEVREAVARCSSAGIRAVMITGDHPRMALAIARELDLLGASSDPAEGGVVTGRELAAMDDERLKEVVAGTSVFARVAPEHKLRIVDALQARGEICAMTGDGVNDAPALKSADIGVAMGITGTDVSKEASDMVLQDDNFSTIVDAVEEGRTIFDNIRRFVRFLLTCNTGEIWVFLLAPLLGMPIPLLPVQILWMNLVTDGFPALGLGVERAEGDVMRRRPRRPGAPILDRGQILHVAGFGLLIALLSIALGFFEWRGEAPPPAAGADASPHGEATASLWQTMLFSTMVFAQLFLALAERSDRRSLWSIGIATNPHLLVALGATTLLQLAVIYLPPARHVFHTVPLGAGELATCFGVGAVVLVAVEIKKRMLRARSGSGVVDGSPAPGAP